MEQNAFEALTFAEKQLDSNTFLLGDSYSLTDVIWTVVLSRLDLLGFSDWINGNDSPLLASYYQRAQNRESFTVAQIQNKWWDK
ncbi:glutathione S-transferase family protein [Psychrobacter sp. 72-O-c]|uniref:glutathione S-transferase family protein n=1 Tax=Psychrobacter sp. 72-O-c TaxID=2774125 RepID=UPI00191964F7